MITGAFDLKGLLAGLTALQLEIGACNIVFDGIDMLLSSLHDEALERQELLQLDTWIRRSDMSAIVTVKTFGAGDRDQIRADFLQYMTDCLIVLASTVTASGSSRTIRIAKYRGSGFAGNPIPVVIGSRGSTSSRSRAIGSDTRPSPIVCRPAWLGWMPSSTAAFCAAAVLSFRARPERRRRASA